MRLVAFVATAVLLGTTIAAQQALVVDYVITPRVFAVAADDAAEVVIIGSGSTFRTREGSPVAIEVMERDGIVHTKLVVVPRDLGAGRVALRVELSLVRAGQVTTAKFDVLCGSETQRATVAARDESGRFMRDQQGRPIYASFDVVTNTRH